MVDRLTITEWFFNLASKIHIYLQYLFTLNNAPMVLANEIHARSKECSEQSLHMFGAP